MSFKDLITSDLDIVINLEEFGEEHIIEGQVVKCVFDDTTLRDRQGGTDYAVAEANLMLFAKSEDLPERRGYGSQLTIDGIPYMIATWDEDMGLSTVTLFITFNS